MSKVKVCVVFKDGTEMGCHWPAEVLNQDEVRTGRPDRIENVTVKFSHKTKFGVHVFREEVRDQAG